MISDVINQEMYKRTFILLTAIFMFGVQQVNLRAFYKLLYGKVSNGRNDTMMWFGIISMVGLPMVGIFDESLWKTLHGISAGMFFIGFMIYARLLACTMHDVRSQFDQNTQVSIASMYSNGAHQQGIINANLEALRKEYEAKVAREREAWGELDLGYSQQRDQMEDVIKN